MITTDKDIIRTVSKRLNKPEIVVKRIFRISIKNIERLTVTDKVYSIRIPYVGCLNFNVKMFLKDKHIKDKSKIFEEGVSLNSKKYISFKKAEKKNDEIIEIYKNDIVNNPAYIKRPANMGKKLLNFYNRGTNFIYQLEEHQNGWAEKKEDYEEGLSIEPKYEKNK